jgi:hypothetical protein
MKLEILTMLNVPLLLQCNIIYMYIGAVQVLEDIFQFYIYVKKMCVICSMLDSFHRSHK